MLHISDKLSPLLNLEKENEQGSPPALPSCFKKTVNIFKSLVESRICCWQMHEASQGNNPVAGHRNREVFHGGDIGFFKIPLLLFVLSRCTDPGVPAWIPAPTGTVSMTPCCGQSNRGCPLINRSHVWDRKEMMGTVALLGISPVLDAPAPVPLW